MKTITEVDFESLVSRYGEVIAQQLMHEIEKAESQGKVFESLSQSAKCSLGDHKIHVEITHGLKLCVRGAKVETTITARELNAFFGVMHYVAANENMCLKTLQDVMIAYMDVEQLCDIKRIDFPEALTTLIGLVDETG